MHLLEPPLTAALVADVPDWSSAATAAQRTTARHPGPCVPDGCSLPRPSPPHLQAFNPIDTNGNGVRDGHMMVSVEVGSFFGVFFAGLLVLLA